MSGTITFEDINPTSTGTMYLTVSAHNKQTFEDDIAVTPYLPKLKLLFFSARPGHKGVSLNWGVKSDFPIDGFNIYRQVKNEKAALAVEASSDLAINKPDSANIKHVKKATRAKDLTAISNSGWEKINQKPVTGKNPYHFLDRSVANEEYEYQLEVLTKSQSGLIPGNGEIIGAVSVSAENPLQFGLKLTPNPARSSSVLFICLACPENINIELFDLAGRKIKSWSNLAFGSGENTFDIPIDNLATGMYQLRISGESFNKVKHLIIMR